MGSGVGGSEGSGQRTPRRWRRAGLTAAILLAFGWAASGPIQRLIGLIGANDWGSDWRWLADGLNRLGAGLPLNHPEYVAAPFSQMANGPAYTWSLHPPYNATLVAPLLLLPAELREAAWTWLMAGLVLAAAWIAWPRGLWWGTHLLLAAVVLGPPFAGAWLGLVDQLHFANPNAAVLLGTTLVWLGRRQGRRWLTAAGLLLAAVKIVPAVGLGAWLLASRSQRMTAAWGIVLALLALALLTVPVLLLDPRVLWDTVAVQLHVIPWDGPTNLAPQVRLEPLLGGAAPWVSRGVGLGLLLLVAVRRLDGPGGFVLTAIAPLFLTPQVWAHWLLIPIVASLLALGSSGGVGRFDGWLRKIWQPPFPAPAAARPATGLLSGQADAGAATRTR